MKKNKKLKMFWLAVLVILLSPPPALTNEFVYVSNYEDETISKINITNNNNTEISRTPVGWKYYYPADQYWDGEVMWVENKSKTSGEIVAYNLTNFTVLGSINLNLSSNSGRKIEVQLTPDRKRLYAATESEDFVFVINTSDPSNLGLLARIDYDILTGIGGVEHPCDVTITPDGKYVFTTDEYVDMVTAINTSKVEELIAASSTVVDVSVSNVSKRISLNLPEHSGSVRPHRAVVSPWHDYKYIFVRNLDSTESVINYSDSNPDNWAEVRVINLDVPGNWPSEFTPDRNFVYATGFTDDVIKVINLTAVENNDTENIITTNISTGDPTLITFSQDGKYAYTGNVGDYDSVSVINTSSHTVIGTISVGNNPWGILASPPHRYNVTYPHNVTLDYPSDGLLFTSNDNVHSDAIVKGSTTDWYWSTGIKNVSLWFNGSYYMWHRHPEIDESGKGGTYVFNLSYLNLDYGTYTWNVQAFDGDGNEIWGASNRTFVIGSDPQITINSPINGTYISDNTPTLKATEIEDNPDTMWYSFDGGSNITSCSFPCITKTFEVNLSKSWTVGSGGDEWQENVTLVNVTTNENGDVILDGQNSLGTNTSLLLHMNEGSGNYTNDTSSNGNNGGLGNSSLGDDCCIPNWTTGKFGNALSFDGVNDYVEVPYSESLNITDEITMMAWIYRKSTSRAYLVYKGKFDESKISYGLYLNPYGSNLGLAVVWGDSGWWDGAWDVPLNQWIHIVGTYNGSYAKIYFNGVLNFTSPLDPQPMGVNNYSLSIGGLYGPSFPFNGTIDDVHILNRALNSTEIADLYNNTYPLYGNLTSISKEAGAASKWTQIGFSGNISPGTNVSIYVNTSPDYVNWSEYVLVKESATIGSFYDLPNSNKQKYSRWRLDLRTNDTSVTPTVYNVTMLAALSDSEHNVTVYANDTLGFENSETIWFNVDTIPPTINVTYPLNQSFDYSNLTLNFTYNETNIIDTCFYNLNNATTNTTIPSCQNGTAIKALVGSNILALYINDSAGNIAQDTVYFTATKDTSPPLITVYSPQNDTYNAATIDLNVSADESIDTWWYTLNSGTNSTFTPNTTITGIAGSNKLIVYANDSSGNINSSMIWFNINLPSQESTTSSSGGGIDPVINVPDATIIITSENVAELIREFGLMTTQFYVVKTVLGGVLGALDYMPTTQDLSEKVDKATLTHVKPLEGDVYTLASEQILTKFEEADKVIVSRGDLGVDSIASIAYARALEVPILLSESENLPQVTNETLEKLGTKNTIILGGSAAISKDVEAQLPNPIMRIGGQDRYYTAVKIALALMRETHVDTIVVTDGIDPDFTSIMVAVKYNAPIVYVDGDEVPDVTKEFFVIRPKTVEKVILVGVSDEAQEKLSPFLP